LLTGGGDEAKPKPEEDPDLPPGATYLGGEDDEVVNTGANKPEEKPEEDPDLPPGAAYLGGE